MEPIAGRLDFEGKMAKAVQRGLWAWALAPGWKLVAAAPLRAAALALLSLAVATNAGAQVRERVRTVTCGLPQQNPLLARLFPAEEIPGPGGGHLKAKMLHLAHPEGGLSTEMWMLSHSIGWWKMKAIRVHPDDTAKLAEADLSAGKDGIPSVRQIIESPFLSRPVVIFSGVPGAEEMVDEQIIARLPDASGLRCASRSDGWEATRIAAAQRALVRHGYNPGPDDGHMGPRTRSALRAFQTEQGLVSHGELDDDTFERLIAQ